MDRITMTRTPRAAVMAGIAAAALFAGACNATDRLLEATDPDIINPADIRSADGAIGLLNGALGRLTNMTAGGESLWLLGGLLTDEWKSGDTFQQRDETDQRNIQTSNSILNTAIRDLHRTRVQSIQAVAALQQFAPANRVGLASAYFAKGYAELQAGLDLCNGIVFSNGGGEAPEFGSQVAITEAFRMAQASLDSAIAFANGTDAANVRIRTAASIAKARAMVAQDRANLGAAAALVASIPTNFSYNATFLQTTGSNTIWSLNNSARRYTVSDSVDATGTIRNALPFVSARDPRVPTSQNDGNGRRQIRAFDSSTPFFAQEIWPTRESDVAIVNGIDARLVQAEARLQANDPAGALVILNALRASTGTGSGGVAGLAPLTLQTTPAAQLSQLFREKAFWTFGRGQRLGDLRRLVRQYQRSPESVFPGAGDRFFKGGNYGGDVNLPVTQAEENNPNFKGCLDRNA